MFAFAACCLMLAALPSDAQMQKVVERWFAAPVAERAALAQEFAAIDVLDARGVEKWRLKILDVANKGEKLELSSGTHYLYDEKKKLGKYIVQGKGSKALVFGLHGGGAGQGDAGSAQSGLGGALGKAGALVIYPEVLAKTEYGWGELDTVKFVIDLLERVKRTRDLDVNRVYLTGHSMGGYGTWTIGARFADRFAGLAAFAGAATPYFDPDDATNTKVLGIQDGILPNLRNVPLFLYQSLDDKNVPPWSNLFASKELKRLQQEHGGFEFIYEEVPDRGHAFPAKGPGPGIEWAMGHVREPRPKKILWQPTYLWKRQFYWLWWDKPEIAAIVHVEITAPNTIAITTKAKSLAGFSLLLDERLVDLEQDIVVRVNGTEAWKGKGERRLTTLLETAAENNDAELTFAVRVKW
jgi:pimeloyl-ACP methyl ester carboxylesterase